MKKGLLSAFMSMIFWGSGQFFICKQRIKGLILLSIQLIVLGIEFFSGYWPEFFAGMIDKFSIRLYGGVFSKAIWGLTTLGEVPGAGNDHSMVLLIRGIIFTIILFYVFVIYVFNIYDAYKLARKIDKNGLTLSSNEYWHKIKKSLFPYLILLPAILFVTFIVLMPIIFSVLTAFTNYNINNMPPANLVSWVGFRNFKRLFTSPVWSSTFTGVFIWTLIWAVLSTATTYLFGMFQAILLNNECIKHKSIYRGIMILPWAIPQMVSLLIFKNMLNGQFGPISRVLVDLGIVDGSVHFLTDPFIAKVTIILVNLWLGFPMFMIMIQGVLSNIDKELFEAAAVDGATGWQKFTKIIFPLVFRATSPLVIMSFASNFNGFGAVFFLTEGGPANASYQFAGSTDILISWIYSLTLDHQMYDMAAVMCILLFLLIGTISIWNFKRTSAFKEV